MLPTLHLHPQWGKQNSNYVKLLPYPRGENRTSSLFNLVPIVSFARRVLAVSRKFSRTQVSIFFCLFIVLGHEVLRCDDIADKKYLIRWYRKYIFDFFFVGFVSFCVKLNVFERKL